MLREEAYERFKQRLFAGDLRPGQFVSQRELADLIGLGSGPVREALKRLEAEALVNLIPQRGIQIADVNVDLIRNAFQLRVILESAAARHYAVHASDAELGALERRTREVMERAGRHRDRRTLDEAMRVDWDLHNAMVDSLGNEIISEVHRVNADKIRLIRLNRQYTFDRVVPAMEEHLAIILALKARDAEAAVTALARHLDVARRRALGL
jgi:DNA-binding GntR family transcriptional regulator